MNPKPNEDFTEPSEGNKFKVLGFTHSREQVINGFRLMGKRGEKEVALSEYKFFTNAQKRRK